MSILSRPYFHDEEAAFAHLESIVWPNGPTCPKCGCSGRIGKIKANPEKRVRLGLYSCNDCKSQFRVTVGTVFEHARIPLHKCLQAAHLLCASKKGISAHQIGRMLGVQYKTAWFLCHRIREAMRDDAALATIMGSPTSVVEADETYTGGKAKNRAHRKPAPKKAVLSLVERDGRVRSFHVANVTSETVKPIIAANADKASMLMTDESTVYPKIGAEFSAHGTVNHSASEYARLGGFGMSTLRRTSSLSSSVASPARTTACPKRTFTGIWRSSISAITIALVWAAKMVSGRSERSKASSASV